MTGPGGTHDDDLLAALKKEHGAGWHIGFGGGEWSAVSRDGKRTITGRSPDELRLRVKWNGRYEVGLAASGGYAVSLTDSSALPISAGSATELDTAIRAAEKWGGDEEWWSL